MKKEQKRRKTKEKWQKNHYWPQACGKWGGRITEAERVSIWPCPQFHGFLSGLHPTLNVIIAVNTSVRWSAGRCIVIHVFFGGEGGFKL